MSLTIRDGIFDVVVVSASRNQNWPFHSVRQFSKLVSSYGLTVGLFGGEDIRFIGVIPNQTTGGFLIIEDSQKRIHRIESRAIIKVENPSEMPQYFEGFYSSAIIPLSAAISLLQSNSLNLQPNPIILGSSNRAFRFATQLKQQLGIAAIVIETYKGWSSKKYNSWEVSKRQFEQNGGRFIEGQILSLTEKSPQLWILKIRDNHGVQIIETGRVIGSGPYFPEKQWIEFPDGSLLFEWKIFSLHSRTENVEGWILDEDSANFLAAKVVKMLSHNVGPSKDKLDSIHRRARTRLKIAEAHQSDPYTPVYQGKWLANWEKRKIQEHQNYTNYQTSFFPVIECFERITCQECVTTCPEEAIIINAQKLKTINSDKCTSCNLCVSACPTQSIQLLKQVENLSYAQLRLSWRGLEEVHKNEAIHTLNRRGEFLGTARVSNMHYSELRTDQLHPYFEQIIEIEVPHHLAWEVRSIKKQKQEKAVAHTELKAPLSASEMVEVYFNQTKRLVKNGALLIQVLFEMGYNRPEDSLLCKDGTCNLCEVTVDGINQLACSVKIRKGMVIKLDSQKNESGQYICHCQKITAQSAVNHLSEKRTRSPESFTQQTGLMKGKCHGLNCKNAVTGLCISQNAMSEPSITQNWSNWIDWSFPKLDWNIGKKN